MSHTVEYYFNSYSVGTDWTTNPQNMVDGNEVTLASTTVDDEIQLNDGNTCDGTDLGTITKVEIRAKANRITSNRDLTLTPVFSGSDDGDDHTFTVTSGTTSWYPDQDITTDTNAPGTWDWTDVQNLDVKVGSNTGSNQIRVSDVEIEITYSVFKDLTATDLITGAPVLDSPVFGNIGVLTATDITADTPVLDSPIFGNIGVCTPVDIATGAPVLGSPVLLHKHVLVASNIITGNSVLEAPILYSKAINWSMLDPYADSPGDDLASVSDSAGDILAASNTIGSDLTVYDDSP